MDAPDHPKHRKLAQDWFRGPSLEAMHDRLTELADKAVARLAAAGGRIDFAEQIARRYPLEAVLAILGLPEDDFDLILRLTQEMFGQEDPDMRRSGASSAVFADVVREMMGYFAQLAADRRANPTDDLASAIVNGTIDGEPMPERDVLSYYMIIATAGHDSTSYAMGGGMHALAANPDQFALLKRDPSLLGNAVEEIFRWTTPARHFMRTAVADTEVAGQQIRAGDRVYLAYAAANLDPALFEDPIRFDIRRPNADRHITFGHGVHFCLGVQLARMELKSLFGALSRRLAAIELAGPAAYTRTTVVGGVKRLPLAYAFEPSPRQQELTS